MKPFLKNKILGRIFHAVERRTAAFINTPLQRGEQRCHEPGNRFNGFSHRNETVETMYLFSVAQISNLLYRRFVIGKAWKQFEAARISAGQRNAILRYSVARQSRNQRSSSSS